jgi:LPS-assembly protein
LHFWRASPCSVTPKTVDRISEAPEESDAAFQPIWKGEDGFVIRQAKLSNAGTAFEARSFFSAAALRVATGKALLMIGVATLALHAPSAYAAKDPSAKPKAASTAPVVDDGLGPHDIYLEADTVIEDHGQKTVTADGHVEVRYQGRTLRADKVVYNSVTGVSHAVGNVMIVSADGTVEYSRDVELDDQFRSAVSLGFSARMSQNITMVAGAAIKRTETINELNNGLYTPCAICKSDGVTPKKPTWSIQAKRIVEDRDHQVIYYKNAIIRVMGVPIFYSPIFWHPDPTAKRSSGLLAPRRIDYSKYRGGSYEQPYYWAISPSADLTISPQINTKVDPFLNLRFREQFYSGSIDIRAGYTYEREFNGDTKFGDDTSRSYLLAKGAFTLDPKWTVGFGAERVTDPTLFHRYSISGVYTDRGPFPTDTDRLISQLYANRQDNQSYFSVAAMSFESLRAAVIQNGQTVGIQSFDSGQAFPVATPVEERFDPAQEILGGRLRLTGNAVTLTRNNPVIDVTDPSGILVAGPQPYSYHGIVQTARPEATPGDPISSLTYRDSRQANGEANWQSTFTFTSGIRVQPFVDGRIDYFSINDGQVLSGVGAAAVLNPAKSNDTRELGTVGANISWPFIKPIGGGSLVIEPLAQLIYANRVKFDPNVPNEDSVSFEYDETNLFSINRFSGFDLDDGGARANLGARATLDLTGGRTASLLVGRTFRTQSDLVFTPQSGLQGTSSDWVTAVSVTPISGISLFNRARLGGNNWSVQREEAGANFGFGRLSASVRYVYELSGLVQVQCVTPDLTVDPNSGVGTCPSPFGGARVIEGSSVIGRVENAEVNGSWFFRKDWGVTVNATHDFVGFEVNNKFKPVWPIVQLGLIYQDECMQFALIYTHDETYSATIGPSNSVGFRLTLNTLGGTFAPVKTSREGSR